MTGIDEFLRARYTEAREAESRKRTLRGDLPFEVTLEYDKDGQFVRLGRFHRVDAEVFFERYGVPAADPAVLADLDAKLAVVKFHPITRDVIAVKPDGLHGFGCATCHQDEGMTIGNGWCDTLLALAAVYADHPDYRAEWRAGEDPS